MKIDEAIDDLYTILGQHNGEYMDYASYEAAVDNLNIISNFVAGTRWIPVSERLPEIETEVIVFSGLLMWIAFLTKEKVWEIVGHDETYDQSLVTHWMPLPEPPKEVE